MQFILLHFSMTICRVCEGEIGLDKRKYAKTTPDAKKYFNTAFKKDPSQDAPSLPIFICHSCYCKMQQYHKRRMKNVKATLNLTLPDTEPAVQPVPRPELKRIAAAQDEAGSRGFQPWKQPNGDICYIMFSPETMRVDRCVTIFHDGKWKVTICGNDQSPVLHDALSTIPEFIDVGSLPALFSAAVGPMCVGNPDFSMLMNCERLNHGLVQANVEVQGPYVFQDREYESTIRTVTCTYLANKHGQCSVCHMYRSGLQSSASYAKKKELKTTRTDASSHVLHAQMTSTELEEKLQNVQEKEGH